MEANTRIQGVTGLAAELAVLEMSADETSYLADRVTRDAERAAQRQRVADQVEAMHDKATIIGLDAVVDGCLGATGGIMQGLSVGAQYDADVAKANEGIDAGANRAAGTYRAISDSTGAVEKANDLAFNSVETGLDSESTEAAQQAEAAKQRAEDANTAAQRTVSQDDQKLSIIQEMLRSDADLMHTLISRS
jgi:hypothetical protein